MIDRYLIVRWLVGNADVLRKIAKAVERWSDTSTLTERLEVVFEIIRALLPIIDSFPFFQSKALPITEEEGEELLASAHSQVGIPIPVLVSVVVPVVSLVLQIITFRRQEK
jgi:hypothetical protein